MSRISTTKLQSNLASIAEDLFTELTPEMAEIIDGGASFAEGLSFTNFQHTEAELYVPPGGNISITTDTVSSLGYSLFNASIYNLDTGASNAKTVNIGENKVTSWTNVRGGNYAILFEDPDNDLISGSVIVSYT